MRSLGSVLKHTKDIWEPTVKKTESVADALQLSQSSNTKQDTLLSLAEEHGWTKDVEDMAKVWK